MPPKATDQQAGAADEQSQDQAGEDGTGVEEQEGSAGDSTGEPEAGTADEESEESDAVELLGQKEFDKVKDDPKALAKALNRAATKKFQQAAATRKELEPYSHFIKALDTDPRKAITAIAKQLGLKVEGSTQSEDATSKTVEKLGDRIVGAFKKNLGPEYDDLSEKLGLAVHAALQEAVPELTRSTEERVDAVIQDTATREAAAALEKFAEAHPDWKEHEDAMTALSEKLQPGEGMSETEYLEHLYYLVTREQSEGEGVKKIIKKMVKSAKATNGNTTVSDKQVAQTPPKTPTFREAAEAARRGVRWE